jgi:hypothetical protein
LSYREKPKGSGYARASKKLQRFHARRSLNAQKIDEGLKAPRAKTAEQWLSHPNRYDIPNVDTPKKK